MDVITRAEFDDSMKDVLTKTDFELRLADTKSELISAMKQTVKENIDDLKVDVLDEVEVKVARIVSALAIQKVGLDDLNDAKNEILATTRRNIGDAIAPLASKVETGFTKVEERFTKVEERFTKIEERFTKVEKRFTKVDERLTKVDERLTKVDERLTKVDERLTKVDERLTNVDERLTKVDERFTKVEERFTKAEEKFTIFEVEFKNIEASHQAINKSITELTHFVMAGIGSHEQRLTDHEAS